MGCTCSVHCSIGNARFYKLTIRQFHFRGDVASNCFVGGGSTHCQSFRNGLSSVRVPIIFRLCLRPAQSLSEYIPGIHLGTSYITLLEIGISPLTSVWEVRDPIVSLMHVRLRALEIRLHKGDFQRRFQNIKRSSN